jgi:succinoglycan biosynthesis transport protein ExoP
LIVEIRNAVSELYSFSNSTEGLPINTILNDWINNIIEAENLKAGIEVLGERIKEFQKQYAIYAPAGANIKRIEREISVSEQEFLEILHGLGLAKLKLQDNELSSNIKAVDPPYFPISPIPTKRKILIVIAALLGFMIVLTTIFVLEYFDNSLKKPSKASRILNLPNFGVLPKILLHARKINLPFITNRLLEIIIQNIESYLKISKSDTSTKTLLFFSTLSLEGKSVIVGNIARKLANQGKKVLVLNYSPESLHHIEITQLEYTDTPPPSSVPPKIKKQGKLSVVRWLLGYPDTRIDFESKFLDTPKDYLRKEEYLSYSVDEKFFSAKNYLEILDQNNFILTYQPDFVLIELPPILYYPYPVGLISNCDVPILVCRSNRIWTDADQGVLDLLMKLTDQKTHYILNGVEPLVIESVLGDLPRKRSWLRRTVKNIFRFQFFTSNQL